MCEEIDRPWTAAADRTPDVVPKEQLEIESVRREVWEECALLALLIAGRIENGTAPTSDGPTVLRSLAQSIKETFVDHASSERRVGGPQDGDRFVSPADGTWVRMDDGWYRPKEGSGAR